MDRSVFFNRVRAKPFGGGLVQSQVDGLNAIIDGFEARHSQGDPRWLAYDLATAYWETDRTMQPIREGGRGAGHPYGAPDPETGKTYYGRGYVQLTWKTNYAKLSPIVGADLVNNPDLALQPSIAATVMFAGMEQGLFTGKKLADFFNDSTSDWVNARTIINAHDRADTIATYAQQFFAAVQAAQPGAKLVTDLPTIPPATQTIIDKLDSLEQKVESLGNQVIGNAAPAAVPIVMLVESIINPMLPAINAKLGAELDKNAVARAIVDILSAGLSFFANRAAGQPPMKTIS